MAHKCTHEHHGHTHLEHYPSCKFLSSTNQQDCFCEERLYKRAVFMSLVSAFVAGVGAYFSGSLALLSDLAHTLFDGVDSFLSLFVLQVVRKYPHQEDRVRTLGAKIAFVMLVVVVYGILTEGIMRLAHPEPIHGLVMMIGASANIAVNTYIVWFSHRTPETERTSTHAQLSLHALSDLLVSVVVLVASLVIWATGQTGVDGLATILVGVYIAVKLLPASFTRITG